MMRLESVRIHHEMKVLFIRIKDLSFLAPSPLLIREITISIITSLSLTLDIVPHPNCHSYTESKFPPHSRI